MPKQYESRKCANAKYKKEKTKLLAVRFSQDDMYLLDYAKSKDNMAGYIRDLIRADMEKNGAAEQ